MFVPTAELTIICQKMNDHLSNLPWKNASSYCLQINRTAVQFQNWNTEL